MKRKKIIWLTLSALFFCFLAFSLWQTGYTQEKLKTPENNSPPSSNSCPVPLPASKETIIVRNTEEPGGFEVENKGADTRLNWQVLVEKKDNDGKWHLLPRASASLNIILTDSCNSPSPRIEIVRNRTKYQPVCRKFVRGEILRVQPWTGFNCAAQCFKSCSADAYFYPGIFRFVVQSCDRREKYYGEEFSLPPHPKKYPNQ